MKTILIPMQPSDAMRATLETTLLLARRCDSYMEGFALRFGINEFVAVDIAGSIPLDTYRQQNLEEAAQARQIFESFMQQQSVVRAAGTSGAPSFGWLDEAPEGEGFVGSYGRVFDVIAMSRPDSRSSGLYNRAVESGLFESGRPLMICPPSPPRQIATNVLIAWN